MELAPNQGPTPVATPIVQKHLLEKHQYFETVVYYEKK